MGIEIKPPVRLRSKRFYEMGDILEEGPLRRFLKEWKPIIPRKKFFEEQLAVYPPVDKELETMREKKRREWLAKGYPSGLIDKALLLADRWASSMAETWAPPGREDIRKLILKSAYPKALSVAQEWIEAMLR